jgi:diketogulonate reductase-like aldo/keto reductase
MANPASAKRPREGAAFRATTAMEARCLIDCATLRGASHVLMPWVGFGTYKLGASLARAATLSALRCGYRLLDSAYIYACEKCEPEVGRAIAEAFAEGTLSSRSEIFVTSKHWRKFHGFTPALGCLDRTLSRLQLNFVDLWLMHWPGPAWSTMNRKTSELQAHGPWVYAAEGHGQDEITALRAETWRAMEEALRVGKARAIGVSNFTIAHLEALKRTAKVWPPAVNQVECHPLYPQTELREYCLREGIHLQAYASLGGQDASKATWQALGGRLLESPPVVAAAAAHEATPAQVLLRWSLQRGCSVTPKSGTEARMVENARVFGFELTEEEIGAIDALAANAPGDAGRLCWRNDPLRLLDFD